jgi:L-proline amide hydrolase
MISMPLFASEMKKLRAKLPKDVEATMRRHEAAGTVVDPEYKQAYAVINKRHIFQPGPEEWPAHLNGAPGSFGTDIYRYMWGLSEACPNGTLKDWDRLDRLHEITIPVLVTSGKNDELTPPQAAAVKKRLPHAEQKIFELSSHMAPVEEPAEYRETVEAFLERAETKSPSQ